MVPSVRAALWRKLPPKVATRFVAAYLLNVSAMDGVAFTGAVVVLLVVAVLAAVVPARRAGSADPLIVLRTE